MKVLIATQTEKWLIPQRNNLGEQIAYTDVSKKLQYSYLSSVLWVSYGCHIHLMEDFIDMNIK